MRDKIVGNTQSPERNKAFDLLKIVCTLIIILHHTGIFYGVLNRGYIAVEFFFITSGFFLYRSYINNPEVDTKHYFLKRAKRLYLEYWFAFVILLIANLCMHSIPYTHWYSPLLELLLLQNIGIPLENASMNYPCWYLSVLLFGGTIIYICLKKLSKEIFNFVAVVIVIGTYFILISQSLYIEQWGTVGYIFYLPFWRGMADMMIGILIYQFPKPKRILGIIVELCSGIGILILLRVSGPFDYLATIFIILLTWSICSEGSILKKIGNLKLINILSKYQYGIYLNHICVILIFRRLESILTLNFKIRLILLLGCIILLAWAGTIARDYFVRRALILGEKRNLYNAKHYRKR